MQHQPHGPAANLFFHASSVPRYSSRLFRSKMFLTLTLTPNPNPKPQVRSGQVWEHTPEQRVAASTLRRYSFGLRLAIAQADARPAMPASFR